MKVAVFATNRSETGLLAPVVKEMEKLGIEVDALNPVKAPQGVDELGEYYSGVINYLHTVSKPDLVFASFDREEMLMVALASKALGIPVAQLHAGDTGDSKGSLNHLTRWAISAYADLLFCNGNESFERAHRFKALTHPQQANLMPHAVGETPRVVYGLGWQVHEVGSTAFDLRWISKPVFSITDKDFDLVIYNPPKNLKVMDAELQRISDVLSEENRGILWVGPNGDKGSGEIERFAKHIGYLPLMYVDSIERENYLWCLKNAKRLIGNSSSFWLEMPTIRGSTDGFIPIGNRNEGRGFIYARRGASKRIAEIVSQFLEGKD